MLEDQSMREQVRKQAAYGYSLSCLLGLAFCLLTMNLPVDTFLSKQKVDERVEFCSSKRELLVFSDLADDFACLLVAAGRRERKAQLKESAWTWGALPPGSTVEH